MCFWETRLWRLNRKKKREKKNNPHVTNVCVCVEILKDTEGQTLCIINNQRRRCGGNDPIRGGGFVQITNGVSGILARKRGLSQRKESNFYLFVCFLKIKKKNSI